MRDDTRGSRRVVDLRFMYIVFMDLEEWVSIHITEDELSWRFGHASGSRPVRDKEELALRLDKALTDGGVDAWRSAYVPEQPVLDGHSWDLVVAFEDGTALASSGINAEPEGLAAFYENLLVALVAG